MHNISDLQLITFPQFEAEDGLLVVYEGAKEVPFSIDRMFMVNSMKGSVRGFHAHKECSQLLIVLKGQCVVTCDDGLNKKEIMLTKASQGLFIPPTLWAEQNYQEDTLLVVLTDKPYDEADYIRQYDDFITFRNAQ